MASALLKSPWFKFLGIFILSYFIFVGLFNIKPIESIINTAYRNISQSTLSIALPDADIKATVGIENEKKDVNVMAINFTWTKAMIDKVIERAKRENITDISVPHRFVNYYLYQFFTVPLIFLLALLLATPLNLKDKTISILVGMSVLLAYLLFKLFLFVIFSISNVKMGIYELSHDNMLILQKLANVLTLGVSIILSVIIWGVVSFRKSSMQKEIINMFNKLDNSQE